MKGDMFGDLGRGDREGRGVGVVEGCEDKEDEEYGVRRIGGFLESGGRVS